MADQQQQQTPAAPSTPPEAPSPRAALSKAEQGARMAAQISEKVSNLFAETRRVRTVHAMQDLTLPCAPLSESGIRAEATKKVSNADATLPSPSVPKEALPQAAPARLPKEDLEAQQHRKRMLDEKQPGIPNSPTRSRDALRETARSAVDPNANAIAFRRGFGEVGFVNSEDAFMLAEILRSDRCAIKQLNLQGTVDVHAGEEYCPEHLIAIKAEVAEEYQPAPKEKPVRADGEDFDEEEEEEENNNGNNDEEEDEAENPEVIAAQKTVEKLSAALEKWGETYETYDKAITFLAKLRMRRLDVLFEALIANNSVTDLDLSENHLGAPEPGEDGRVNFAPLRKLAKLLDETTALRQVNLSANNMGPHGVGIVAKAMTKNITIHTLDLDGVGIFDEEGGSEAPAEVNDPEQEEQDPMFGEFYPGLEAISEILKKNKFLRVLSLRNNRIKAEADDTMGEWDDDDEIEAARKSIQGEETEEGQVLPPNPELIEEAVQSAEQSIVQFGADTQLYKLMDPFRKYHRITVLDLGGNHLGDAGAKIVASALEKNKSVTHLDLSDNDINLRGIVHLTRLVSRNSTISTLVIAKNQIKQRKKSGIATKTLIKHLTAFSEAIAATCAITTLDISDMNLGAYAGNAILSAFDRMNVTVLRAGGNEFCAPPHVIPPRKKRSQVEAEQQQAELDEDEDKEKDFVMPPEATAEPDLSTLRCIINGGQREEGWLQLSELDISGNRLGVAGARLLADESNSRFLENLTKLNVARNTLTDEGAQLICDAILRIGEATGSPSCTELLNLEHNKIANGSIIGSFLRGATWIQNFDVSHNRLGDNTRGFVEMLDALGNGNTQLKSIDIMHNNIGETPAENEAVVLLCQRAAAPLEKINLMDNPLITIEDTIRAIGALANNTSIRSLRISSAAGDRHEVLQAALNCLEANTTLTDLDVCCPPQTAGDEQYAAVKDALLRNAIQANAASAAEE